MPRTVPVELMVILPSAWMSPTTLPLICARFATMPPLTRPDSSTVTSLSERSMVPSMVPLTNTSPLPVMSPLIDRVAPSVAVDVATGVGFSCAEAAACGPVFCGALAGCGAEIGAGLLQHSGEGVQTRIIRLGCRPGFSIRPSYSFLDTFSEPGPFFTPIRRDAKRPQPKEQEYPARTGSASMQIPDNSSAATRLAVQYLEVVKFCCAPNTTAARRPRQNHRISRFSRIACS